MDGYECAGCCFYSNFDSGNLNKVEYVPSTIGAASGTPTPASTMTGRSESPDLEFNLWTKPDCGGTEFENANRTWFYFGMRCSTPAALVRLNMVDLNKQAKLYSQGMGPVYKVVPGRPQWERICDKPTYTSDNNVFTLSFKIRTPADVQSTTYLAFTYPYTYQEIQHKLDVCDKKVKNDENQTEIYYVRECICYSLQGRRMDLLTVSGKCGASNEREPRLKYLFPDLSVERPFKFPEKKVIFVSARVHPGETPSSFVFNGLLNLLLARDDPIASMLRRLYVFKLIPCLNPDGVYNGHYRTDTRGVNLNRVYLNPNMAEHPTIFASRSLIRYHHYGFEKEEVVTEVAGEKRLSHDVGHMTIQDENNKNLLWCNVCLKNFIVKDGTFTEKPNCPTCGEPASPSTDNANVGDGRRRSDSGLFLYVDMHGHASKKGIFMYGNHFDDVESGVECMLLPKIMSLNNHNFHFTACNFTERNMYLKDKRDGMSKEGSGRVAVYKLTGLVQSYTLECNYNTGRLVNILPPSIKESMKTHNILVPPKYNPHIFEEVGKAIGSSVLDLTSQNPHTRLPHSEYHSLSGLREWLRQRCSLEISDLATARKSPGPPSSARNKPRQFVPPSSAGLHAQGKAAGAASATVRSCAVKSRALLLSKYAPKKVTMKPRPPKLVVRKQPQDQPPPAQPQPGCSTSGSKIVKPRNSLTMTSATTKRPTKEDDEKKLRLKEICYIKDAEGKRMIAKYENAKEEDDSLVVAWEPNSAKPQVFTHRGRVPAFLSSRAPGSGEEQRGASKRGMFRVHNFAAAQRPKRSRRMNKRPGPGVGSSAPGAGEPRAKKKLGKKKSRKDLAAKQQQ